MPYVNKARPYKKEYEERMEKIKEENKDKDGIENLDFGFRVFKVDSSNMKDIYYSVNDYKQDLLSSLESNIKEDRSELDLLYQVVLESGVFLSHKHSVETLDGLNVHTVGDNYLIACFAEKVSENVVKEIAKRQPIRTVFRDSSFGSSPERINVTEIFKILAPNTDVKVI
jgi:adenine-specific DNA-methyltransferase